jgi:apolipoprotein N-acyltransferase
MAALLGGATIGGAWLCTETAASAALGWVAVALLVSALRSRRAYLAAYLGGVVGHVVGFYWVYSTVVTFGGFGALVAGAVFGLFVATGALQFLLIAVVDHALGRGLDRLALRAATAVVASELLMPRLFPWHFGHTQVAFRPLAQAAALGGAPLVTFLMVWLAEALVRATLLGERRPVLLAPAGTLALALGFGLAEIRAYDATLGPTQEVIVVQGNAGLEAQHDLDLLESHLKRLATLTRSAARPGALVVWPEGSIPAYVHAATRSVRDEPALPWFNDGTSLLIGGYALDNAERRYNAAFGIHADGRVSPPYFKQILIPFGEAIPFATTIPWLASMNARAGVFTPGTDAEVFHYPMQRPDGRGYTLKVAPLICYEDTSPALARRATRKGAELLVNLTYDTWFGRSAAADQHHLIASFRAIETRRYLVRATNSGTTAVVDPVGRTVCRLAPFTEATATARVALLKGRTVYATVGEGPWWAWLAVVAAGAATRKLRK